jgi:hypothetical protein
MNNKQRMSARQYYWFCKWIENMTKMYTEKNKEQPVYTYHVENEEELKEKQRERLDDTWIKI